MEEKYFNCPICGIGELVSETIEEPPNGERNEIYCYSCGHRHSNRFVPTVGAVGDFIEVSTNQKSGKRTGYNPKYEIEKQWKKDDKDNPNQPVLNFYYTNRKDLPKSRFHVAKYVSGEIKHVHCKTCNSKYQYHSTKKLEDLFFIDLGSRPKIECLCCHAKFEQ